MSKHWNPDNVVRPAFGRRQPPRALSTQWLNAEDYQRLSPAEKRQLFAARQERRQTQAAHAYARPTRRNWKRRSHSSSDAKSLALVAVLIGVASVRVFGIPTPVNRMIHPPSAPITASFSYCKWGGGTNCVVDGDTFWINGQDVRIANIDAPETHDYGCASELQLGDQATAKLYELLNSGAVTMTSIDRDHDKYGRLLRNVSVNGEDVGERLISAGVARAYAGGRRPWC